MKAFTNRDFVGVRIWLTPPLPDPPYRRLAPRFDASSGNGRCSALASSHGAHPDVAFCLEEIDAIIAREVATKALAKERTRRRRLASFLWARPAT